MEPCKKLDLSEATMGDFDVIIDKLRQRGALWSMSAEELVKSFLGEALCYDFFPESFATMRSSYIKTSFEENKDDVPNERKSFCKYILEKYFGLTQEPKAAFIHFYERAIMHLADIDNRIKDIEDEVAKVRKDNIPSVSQEKLPVLDYYLKRNVRAREDVIKFLKEEIYDFAFRQCIVDLDYISTHPYHYDFAERVYKVKYPTMISNKFGNIGWSVYRTLPQMYKNRKEEFKAFLDAYIEDEGIVQAIRNSCEVDYVINKRREVIEEALTAYENGSNIVFSSVCLLLVEGILHDVCVQLGASENDILGKGFQEKINLLNDKYELEFNYEYYSFKFRLLRNRVAHGIAEAAELHEVSEFLLLDLYDVIKISRSNRILLNPKISFLGSVLAESKLDKYEYVAGCVILKDVLVPEFYDVTEASNEVLLLITEDGFWDYVDSLFTSDLLYRTGVGIELLKRLKELGIEAITEKCKARLKKHADVKVKFDMEKYIKSMLQYY